MSGAYRNGRAAGTEIAGGISPRFAARRVVPDVATQDYSSPRQPPTGLKVRASRSAASTYAPSAPTRRVGP